MHITSEFQKSQHTRASWCATYRATSFHFVFSRLTHKVVHAVPHGVPHLGIFPPIIYINKGIKVRQMFFCDSKTIRTLLGF